MAIASVGSLGTVGSATANQASLILTTSATLEAGNLGVIVIGVDNNQTTDGDEGAVSGVVDSAGNTWTKAAEFTNGQGTAQTGAVCSIWYCRVAVQLNSGGTITASFTNAASRDAAAATAWEFTVGGPVALEGTPTTLANDNADLASLDLTTSNISCLRIRGAGVEGTQTSVTPTATWTGMTLADAGAAGAANMVAWAEFKISTGTGAASDPTLSNTARDGASVYIAIKESGTAYALTAAAGAYTFTGVAALQNITRLSSVGAFTLTGVAALKKITKVAAAGAYTLTGMATLFEIVSHTYVLIAGTGAYVVTGGQTLLRLAVKEIRQRIVRVLTAVRTSAPSLSLRRAVASALARVRRRDPSL